ncbi:hypothetical protein BTZ20_2870 [Rhodococcus sp. MTM3W5.2]|uniref:hypothetical protein n=1 Tax=Rhodococcus sp. MTM3W5.2 TaxID=1805827 RepID=UPI000979143D|nr:hypothetical protein [Rhodococcus sp. MTM3W5.2]AQA26269.1 hypothetical protein BTZ20_2870 [Rhodococcus sp. MTM3W5.2]
MDSGKTTGFALEDLSVGPYAHGFGTNADGQAFAFRVRRSTLFVEVYRADLESTVPDKSDVVATAERSMITVDLTDERSIAAAVRDAVAAAEPVNPGVATGTTLRALLGRLSSILDRR